LEDETTPNEAHEEEESTPLTLEERVAYLETQNQGLKRVGVLALILVLILGGLVVHKTHSDIQSTATRGLTLLGDDNLLVGAITPDPQGRVQFLKARYGELRAADGLPEGFVGYAFYDADGRARMLIGENKDRHTIFLVVDPERGVAFDPLNTSPTAAPTPAAKASPTPAAVSPSPSPSAR